MLKAIRVIAYLILFLPLTGVIANTEDITAQSPSGSLNQTTETGRVHYLYAPWPY